MTNGQQPAAAWDLALEGITKLATQLEALQATTTEMQAQISYIRQSAAPISMMRAQENDISDLSKALAALDTRVVSVEQGATAAILERLASDAELRGAYEAADQEDRHERRKANDRRDLLLFLGFLAVVVAILFLAYVIWGAVRR
jgi:hypothetical protein